MAGRGATWRQHDLLANDVDGSGAAATAVTARGNHRGGRDRALVRLATRHTDAGTSWLATTRRRRRCRVHNERLAAKVVIIRRNRIVVNDSTAAAVRVVHTIRHYDFTIRNEATAAVFLRLCDSRCRLRWW